GAHRCLIDVGGGAGGFLVSAGERHAGLQLLLFDLPAVAARAADRFAAAGLSRRARAVPGSFLSDALPAGADIATLVRVVHDHDDTSALQILRNVRQALPPGGTLLVAEPLAGTPGAERMGDAYFGFYLLAMGRGRPRTAQRLGELLRAAGFDRVRQLHTRLPLQTSVLLARVPDARHV
ncbi:MAG: methyltransferase domain-containing protein, partial [Comamonadaceae bacterium]